MTHGRGKKAGRGAGLRGGRGNAGLLKHRYIHMVKNMPDHFGKHGFKRPQSIVKKDKIINIGQLEDMFPDKKEVDLGKEGFDKLLGGGNIKTKMKIMVNSASEKAIAKIMEKGGEVILPEEPVVEETSVEEEITEEQVEETTFESEAEISEKKEVMKK
ncbi:MAG: uL15 family ribosomal protein [Thermoplasmatales archaeon]|nr:MAG: uL15 family ribosomal protein [Thermoplasmatales archaeon]